MHRSRRPAGGVTRSGDYPHIQALFGDADTRRTWELIVEVMTAESRFEQGLDLLLDGIEARPAGGGWGDAEA